MAINTTNITGDIFLPTGAVREKSYVIFEMTGIDTDADSDAVIVPFPIRAPIDDAGSIDVDLWPNSDGVRSTFYNVTIEVYNGTRAHMVSAGKIAVPAVWGSYDLNDLLPVSPPSGASVDDYIAYLEQAVGTATTAASTASDAADRAEAAADRVDLGALDEAVAASSGSAALATVSAAASSGSASFASTSAALATVSAAASSGSASFASTSAASAIAARDAAISAGTWTYTPADAAALAAITGMVSGNTAYVRSTMHVWKYSGSAWVDTGESPLALKGDKEVTGTLARVYEGGKWARSGVGSAIIGSDRKLVQSTAAGVQTLHGPIQTKGTFNNAEAVGLDGKWDRSGYLWAVIGSDRKLIMSNVVDEYVASADDVYTAFIENDGTGVSAVYVENTSDGSRVRVSAVGANVSGLQFIGDDVALWTSATNAKGAPSNLYWCRLGAGAVEHAFRPIKKLACWGDSITAGNWMQYLAAAGTANTYYNFGKSSDTSLGIASRMGAYACTYSVAGGSIPASGAVTVTQTGYGNPLSKFAVSDASITGYLAGIWGTLTRTSGVVTFTRMASGAAVAIGEATFIWGTASRGDANATNEAEVVPFTSDMTHIFFAGRNNASNITGIQDDFRAMVAHISAYTKRFVIIPYFPARYEPIGSTAYTTRASLLANLRSEWPNNTLDLLPSLLAAYNPAVPQDVTDVANGVPPSSLMTDDIHPNDAGKAVEAQAVHNFLTQKAILK